MVQVNPKKLIQQRFRTWTLWEHTGTLPRDKDNSSSCITILDVDGVWYDGFFTIDIDKLFELTIMNLSKSKFRWPIPESITKLNNLTTLVMYGNYFTTSLITLRLKMIQELNISRNKLNGFNSLT